VEPVLAVLALGHPLEQDLHALAVRRDQALVGAYGRAISHIAEHLCPEVRGAGQVGAVDHDDQLAVLVSL
jgi:hypothetical protein